MPRLRRETPPSGHTVLVVDDDADLRLTIARLLESAGHTVLTAASGPEALTACRENDVHLILLDYFMPGMTGEDVVRELRAFDQRAQIVLQTGYASERPPRDMLRDLDIQGYHDKSEGPDKLLVWVDAALKTYRHVRALSASRDGLSYILKVTPELHRLQPLEDLLRGVLMQLQGIIGFTSACVATMVEIPVEGSAFVATPDDHQFRVRVGTGRFQHAEWLNLSQEERETVRVAAMSGSTRREPYTTLPLKVADRTVGVVLVDLTVQPEADLSLLELFATQAAVAIENARLFELATVDDLTGLVNKRAWLSRLEDALHLATRHELPTSVLLLDIDHFKRVNDTHGHLAGDQVLRQVAEVLRSHARTSDLAGRYGGEELVILLPHTDAAGAVIVAERLRTAIETLELDWNGTTVRVTASIGAATLTPPTPDGTARDTAAQLIERADTALYAAKHAGRNRVASAHEEPA